MDVVAQPPLVWLTFDELQPRTPEEWGKYYADIIMQAAASGVKAKFAMGRAYNQAVERGVLDEVAQFWRHSQAQWLLVERKYSWVARKIPLDIQEEFIDRLHFSHFEIIAGMIDYSKSLPEQYRAARELLQAADEFDMTVETFRAYISDLFKTEEEEDGEEGEEDGEEVSEDGEDFATMVVLEVPQETAWKLDQAAVRAGLSVTDYLIAVAQKDPMAVLAC